MTLFISNILRGGLALGLSLALTGCATTTRKPAELTPPAPSAAKPVEIKGIKHKVRKGETLWSIARTYNVSVDAIVQSNGISNAASIEEDQLVFIPGADAVRDVVVPSPTGKDDGNDYIWPVRGKVISYFQDRREGVVNTGIDVKAVEGDVVRAARAGKVVFADHLAGQGETIILDHGDGFFSVYGHNERILVRLGDRVLKGDKLSQVAREGKLAFLHFEVRKGDTPTNPLHYLP